MELAIFGNQYMNENEPWKNPKIERDIIFNCCIIAANLSVVLLPFIPSTCKKIQKMMGFKQDKWHFVSGLGGNHLSDVEPLFNRVEKDDIDAKLKSLKQKVDKIPYEDFSKVKMNVATVLSGERVKNSDKLVKLQVDIGTEKRQIIAGIGKVYKLEDLVGKQIIVVTNLEPRNLKGEVSDGMLLAAGTADDLALLIPDKKVNPGSDVE
jgi:methionyl-tRNA synthetase